MLWGASVLRSETVDSWSWMKRLGQEPLSTYSNFITHWSSRKWCVRTVHLWLFGSISGNFGDPGQSSEPTLTEWSSKKYTNQFDIWVYHPSAQNWNAGWKTWASLVGLEDTASTIKARAFWTPVQTGNTFIDDCLMRRFWTHANPPISLVQKSTTCVQSKQAPQFLSIVCENNKRATSGKGQIAVNWPWFIVNLLWRHAEQRWSIQT